MVLVTHDISARHRFNSTCSYKMDCNCAAGYMGPQCDTPICPDNCNNGVGVNICFRSFRYNKISQNQKGFGCIVAAVLLILSSKELI